METSVPALLVAVILLVSTVLFARTGYTSLDALGMSWKDMETRAGEQSRTRLTVTGTQVDDTGANVDVTLDNEGQTAIGDFERMDVVVQYTSESATYHVLWIPYTPGPLQSNTWTVQSITGDMFEPGIFNPGETLEMRIRLNPPVGMSTTNWAIISTRLGVSLSAYFTR
jgi:flagellar protein FlaF